MLALFDDGGIGADLAAGLDQFDRVDQLVALVTLEIKPDVDDKKINSLSREVESKECKVLSLNAGLNLVLWVTKSNGAPSPCK